ncbi:RBM43 protein, partial [Callaeas wilsoni]|nr:RBM43 protein [Callaeas wilsoni]
QVFLSVSSILNMAAFKDHFVLEDLLEEVRRQSPALSFGPLRPDGRVAVRGPFPALRLLRDFLLSKAESLSGQDRREGKPQQRGRSRLQEHGGVPETRGSTRGAGGERHVVVLDTDVYQYMRRFLPQVFQASDVVISGVTDGDITTVCLESAGRKAGAAAGARVKKIIENQSVELQETLRKARISFEEQSRGEKQRYKRLCESIKPRYPAVLLIPYDTHIDVVGTSADVFGFTEEVKS